MALAEELPEEAIKAFTDVLRGRGAAGAAKQLRVKDEGQLREAIAAAIGRVPLQTLIGAGVKATSESAPFGVALEDAETPEGWQPEGVLVLVRGIDAAGERSIFWRQGGDVVLWEMVGMLECAGDAVREQITTARAEGN